MFGEQIEHLNARQYALEGREQIGRGSYEPGIRVRGLLVEAADLDVLGRAVDLGNQQVARRRRGDGRRCNRRSKDLACGV